jgi:hypothetical protein
MPLADILAKNSQRRRAAEQKKSKETVMSTVGALPSAGQGVACSKCGGWLLAPQYRESFPEERLILDLWSCMGCGHKFETEAFAPVETSSKIAGEAPQESLPSLLVA